ncbi:MAG: hypothetical protein ACRC18_06785 [Cetobacterium sp.]
MENFAIKDCFSISIFDNEGKKVLDFDKGNDAEISLLTSYKNDKCNRVGVLTLNSEIFSHSLLSLKFDEKFNKTDFEKELANSRMEIGEYVNQNTYKAIGYFKVRQEDGTDKDTKVVIYKMRFATHRDIVDLKDNFTFSCEKVSNFKNIFIIEIDEDGRLITFDYAN